MSTQVDDKLESGKASRMTLFGFFPGKSETLPMRWHDPRLPLAFSFYQESVYCYVGALNWAALAATKCFLLRQCSSEEFIRRISQHLVHSFDGFRYC
ncbi:hypothetical protein GWI33_021835 [Rhynchophorus ferrugineus]|uniref:Uncharacterized protein n=1 Tax=Rhynchophorus ferrugineus TaxID=354439 RepID=A0A834INY7_RHYFE|nr:hypothetical protein GWI33_021835 [Rhynchophorus ferrugineus]